MMNALEQLVYQYHAARHRAAQADAEVEQLRAAIVAHLPAKEEGTSALQVGDERISVTFKLSRTADTAALQRDWHALPPQVKDCFAWKADVRLADLRAVEKLDAAAFATVAQYVTTKPAKPALKIEQKTE